MKISDSAVTVLSKRYLAKDENNKPIETVEGMFHRVADAVAAADATYSPGSTEDTAQKFYDMMTNLEFLPNSPTLMNAGRPLGQLSACFVLPVADSMEAIFDAIKQAALIHKSGGGTGFSFTRLRPKGSVVNSTGGVASGPISFMKVFNAATEAVKQGGTRRGANMGILQIDHPDILEFITCKSDTGEITNFNLSVAITEDFMKAVEAGRDYNLVDPKTQEVVGTLNAPEVFEKIVAYAHQNGEPGIIFIDRLNRDNIVPSQGAIEATNPCGEQPLLPYESCNLGSINLVEMLKQSGDTYAIDYDKLGRTVDSAVHFLDNVIDINNYPIEEIGRVTKATRKIGLGVMGWADMLLLLGVAYNSQAGVSLGETVMEFINIRAKEASHGLARIRGSFPLFEESVFKNGRELRNGTCTTIAPTGTLSIIAGVSSGVEPVFAYVYIRNVMDGTKLIEVNPILKARLEALGLYTPELMEKIAQVPTLRNIDEIPDSIRQVFVSAHDVEPVWHIRMQAAFQRHLDNAVSKTVNFPNTATKEEVAEVYKLAYQLDCKGVTIYRDGSRENQVLNVGKVNDGKEKDSGLVPDCASCQLRGAAVIEPRDRPSVTQGITEKVKIGCGNLYITVNYDENGICEVFTNTGRHGGCPSQSEATSRLTSIALRAGIDVGSIIEQLRGIRCPSTIRQPGMGVTSCPDAIARTIEKVVKTYNLAGASKLKSLQAQDAPANKATMRFCPECSAKVEHEGGCVICRSCGYSKCN